MTLIDKTVEERLMGVTMRIRGAHPFFGTLSLFTKFHINDSVQTAATDGKDIWLNPDFISKLDFDQYAGLIIHELLHAALNHCHRRREREPILWNIAADIVVNGAILRDTTYSLPEGSIQHPTLCLLSVEEVYEQLRAHSETKFDLRMVDLVEGFTGHPGKKQQARRQGDYWRSAISKAAAIAKQTGRGYGHRGLGLKREIDEFQNPSLGWKELLWEHVVSTPSDYSGFDRRFLWQGIYLDAVAGESVKVAIAIDTSGSIAHDELTAFLSEIQGMLDAYPNLEGMLFYADANLYGPYEISRYEEMSNPKGGGGTRFDVFFNYIKKCHNRENLVCIYFTDGFGVYPSEIPDCDVVWVISDGGIASTEIPFGNVVRLAN